MENISDLHQYVTYGSECSFASALGIIVVFGILGNALIIFIIVYDKHRHKVSYYYVVCFSLSNICRSFLCLSLSLSAALGGSYVHSTTSCNILAFANSFFVYSSANALLLLAIDRYASATFSRAYDRCTKGCFSLCTVSLVWIIAFIVAFLPVFGVGRYRYIYSELQCTFYHRRYEHNDTLGYVLFFVSLMVACLVLYSKIFLFKRAHRRMCPLQHQPARSTDWNFFGPGANLQAMINLLNGFTGLRNPMGSLVQNIPQTFGRVVNLRVVRNGHFIRMCFLPSVIYCTVWTPYVLRILAHVFGYDSFISDKVVFSLTLLSHSYIVLCPIVMLLFQSPLRSSLCTVIQSCKTKSKYFMLRRERSRKERYNLHCIELCG
ncbi:hypothetical protein ACJMK2_017213 [Sinanodonta woodiana]|uniref:G-protein coupled receptors family 1 profile domain-containing protein n=1 Tax=Sinanodonta woodiana TaxID=1069815 RepID=A0ABD3UZI8_SINWO